MWVTASAPGRRTRRSPCPASGKTADEPAKAGRDRASGLQLDQGRGLRHAHLGGHSVYHIQLPSGKIVQVSSPMPNATANGRPGMTRCSSTGKMTAAWCCNHEGIETTQTGGRAAAGHRHPLLAVPLLPAALHHRREDQLRRRDVAILPYTDVVSWATISSPYCSTWATTCCRMSSTSPYLGSLKIALVITMLCLLIGYPLAYAISRANKGPRPFFPAAHHDAARSDGPPDPGVMPGWGSSATTACSTASRWAWADDEPLQILNTNLGGLASASYTPTCCSWCCCSTPNLVKHDQSLLEAASDLGAAT